MNNVGVIATLSVLLVATAGLPGCMRSHTDHKVNAVVGAWVVRDPGGPFPWHMYVFNADGTMQQANPDAGDPHSSDSDGKGIWVAGGDRVRGKWVEITADRASHQFTGRTEISYDIKVNADAFAGTITARSYDAKGTLTDGPTSPTALEGKRVTLP